MPQVDILIQGRSYAVQCAEGEEKRAHFLAAHINRHAARLVARLGAMSDAQLLLMTGMMVADELLETRERLGQLEQLQEKQQETQQEARGELQEETENTQLPLDDEKNEKKDTAGDAVAVRIEGATRRLERIAAMLDTETVNQKTADTADAADAAQKVESDQSAP